MLRVKYFAPTTSRMTSAPRPPVAERQLLHEVVLRVVDQDLRAEIVAGLERGLPGCGDSHGRAQRAGHLDGHGADAGGAAVDEDGLAGPQARR